MPLIFAAYAIGRGRFELWSLFALVTAEAIAFAIWGGVWSYTGAWRDHFLSDCGKAALLGAPCWIPIVGFTYGHARKRYGPEFTIALVAAELVSIALWCVSLQVLDF